ncbi:MAG: hypothetical protein Q3983_03765 [Capnocytophaga sp.]|nr:hypothetical protein [Capnocytophaga sp.]
MKNLLILLSFFYFHTLFAQQKTDWELWNLKNSPSEVTYIYRQALPDSLVDKTKLNSVQQTLVFDENGFITLQSDNFGEHIAVYRYEYDHHNRIIKGNYLNVSKGWERSIRATYNHKGQKTHIEMFDGDKLTFQRIFYYDTAGNVVKMEYFDEDLGISRDNPYKVTYVYDKKGLKIEENVQNQVVVRYEYDKNGNPIQEKYYNYTTEDLTNTNTLQYEYDKQQNWTKQQRFYNGSLSYYTIGLIRYGDFRKK